MGLFIEGVHAAQKSQGIPNLDEEREGLKIRTVRE